MDTTPEYVKMCEGAREWLEGGPPTTDYLWVVCSVCGTRAEKIRREYYVCCAHRKRPVYLPTQDQLQRMLSLSFLDQIDVFWEWLDRGYYPDLDGDKLDIVLPSWEQLWLAFVMHEKGKHWTGEEWK